MYDSFEKQWPPKRPKIDAILAAHNALFPPVRKYLYDHAEKDKRRRSLRKMTPGNVYMGIKDIDKGEGAPQLEVCMGLQRKFRRDYNCTLEEQLWKRLPVDPHYVGIIMDDMDEMDKPVIANTLVDGFFRKQLADIFVKFYTENIEADDENGEDVFYQDDILVPTLNIDACIDRLEEDFGGELRSIYEHICEGRLQKRQ